MKGFEADSQGANVKNHVCAWHYWIKESVSGIPHPALRRYFCLNTLIFIMPVESKQSVLSTLSSIIWSLTTLLMTNIIWNQLKFLTNIFLYINKVYVMINLNLHRIQRNIIKLNDVLPLLNSILKFNFFKDMCYLILNHFN